MPTPCFEPGDLVINPAHEDWGLGQVQSVVNGKITVNFEDIGKVVIQSQHVTLKIAIVGPQGGRY